MMLKNIQNNDISKSATGYVKLKDSDVEPNANQTNQLPSSKTFKNEKVREMLRKLVHK